MDSTARPCRERHPGSRQTRPLRRTGCARDHGRELLDERQSAERAIVLRARLLFRGIEGRPEAARAVVAEMEAAGLELLPDDHASVVTAYAISGRGEEAEQYVGDLGATAAEVRGALYALVIQAYAVARAPSQAVRVFEEVARSGLVVGDEHRSALLLALAAVRDHRGARRWLTVFESEHDVSPEVYALAVEAHAEPGARADLAALEARLDARVRTHPQVTAALVSAWAGAGEPDRATALLPKALAGLADDSEARDAVACACVVGQVRYGTPQGLDGTFAIIDAGGVVIDAINSGDDQL